MTEIMYAIQKRFAHQVGFRTTAFVLLFALFLPIYSVLAFLFGLLTEILIWFAAGAHDLYVAYFELLPRVVASEHRRWVKRRRH